MVLKGLELFVLGIFVVGYVVLGLLVCVSVGTKCRWKLKSSELFRSD